MANKSNEINVKVKVVNFLRCSPNFTTNHLYKGYKATANKMDQIAIIKKGLIIKKHQTNIKSKATILSTEVILPFVFISQILNLSYLEYENEFKKSRLYFRV